MKKQSGNIFIYTEHIEIKKKNKRSMWNYQRVLSQKILFLSLYCMQNFFKHNFDFEVFHNTHFRRDSRIFLLKLLEGFHLSIYSPYICSPVSLMVYCFLESNLYFHSTVFLHFSVFSILWSIKYSLFTSTAIFPSRY